VAEGMSLTCGQRCNATSRILVDIRVETEFASRLADALARFVPGFPMDDATSLGPLISAAAIQRYETLLAEHADWLVAGQVVPEAGGRRGYYVLPAVRRGAARAECESFVPIADFDTFGDFDTAVEKNNASPFGLTASVFTRTERTFWRLADELCAGNVYANLATTFSPSTLPFGGWGLSGNGRSGGRGFIRFCTAEQAIQLGKDTFLH
jgi:acyl-CoA reductase-like NAD-dependent aldehyde dehydrogenase